MKPFGPFAPGSTPLPKNKCSRRAAIGGITASVALPAFAQQAATTKPITPDTVNSVGRNFDEIVEAGVIKIAVYDDFAPYSFHDADGPRGIDTEIASLIARELDLKLDLMFITAGESVDEDLRNYIWRGPRIGARAQGSHVVDAVANLMLHVPYDRVLDQRNELAVLFSPYCEEYLTIARDPEQVGAEFSVFDLDGLPLAAELDSLGDYYFSTTWGGRLKSNVTRFVNPLDAIEALKRRDVAAYMGPLTQIEWGLGETKLEFDITPPEFPGLHIKSWSIGAAVRENARDLRWAGGDVIDAARNDGRLEAIFSSYGVTYNPPVV